MLIKKNLKFAFNYASARWTSLLKLFNCVATLCVQQFACLHGMNTHVVLLVCRQTMHLSNEVALPI